MRKTIEFNEKRECTEIAQWLINSAVEFYPFSPILYPQSTHSKTSPVSTVITYSCSPDYRRGRHYYTEDGKSCLRCFFEELTTGLEFFLFALFHDRSIIPYRLPGFRFGYKKRA